MWGISAVSSVTRYGAQSLWGYELRARRSSDEAAKDPIENYYKNHCLRVVFRNLDGIWEPNYLRGKDEFLRELRIKMHFLENNLIFRRHLCCGPLPNPPQHPTPKKLPFLYKKEKFWGLRGRGFWWRELPGEMWGGHRETRKKVHKKGRWAIILELFWVSNVLQWGRGHVIPHPL